MKTRSVRRAVSDSDDEDFVGAPDDKWATADCHQATQLDICRCPLCGGPMTARNGRDGPSFACLCPPQARSRARTVPTHTVVEARHTKSIPKEEIVCLSPV
jgi:hypothetical protein